MLGESGGAGILGEIRQTECLPLDQGHGQQTRALGWSANLVALLIVDSGGVELDDGAVLVDQRQGAIVGAQQGASGVHDLLQDRATTELSVQRQPGFVERPQGVVLLPG